MKMYCDSTRNTIITYSLIRARSQYRESTWTYGIDAEMTENGSVTCRSSIDDVFCIREDAEDFIELLAENGVEPCHLSEVIYDRLSV